MGGHKYRDAVNRFKDAQDMTGWLNIQSVYTTVSPCEQALHRSVAECIKAFFKQMLGENKWDVCWRSRAPQYTLPLLPYSHQPMPPSSAAPLSPGPF